MLNGIPHLNAVKIKILEVKKERTVCAKRVIYRNCRSRLSRLVENTLIVVIGVKSVRRVKRNLFAPDVYVAELARNLLPLNYKHILVEIAFFNGIEIMVGDNHKVKSLLLAVINKLSLCQNAVAVYRVKVRIALIPFAVCNLFHILSFYLRMTVAILIGGTSIFRAAVLLCLSCSFWSEVITSAKLKLISGSITLFAPL